MAPDTEPALDLAGRRDLYALSSRLLAAEIDAPLYRQLCSPAVEAPLAAHGLGLVEPELRALGEAQALEELAVEYCRLFIGPLPVCVPFESSQREDALLGGRPRRKLEDFMTRHGFELEPQAAVASVDHVAVELGMLAHLYGTAADPEADAATREGALGAVHELLSDHLLPWGERFFSLLSDQSRWAVYRAVGALTSKLLADELRVHRL